MRRYIIPLLLCLCLLAGCDTARAPNEENDQSDTVELMAMDTFMRVTAYGEHREAAELAKDEITALEALLSVTDEGSEIYAANHAGGKSVALSDDTAALLERALALCESTGGALDVTIYPVVRAWGFTTDKFRVPEADELAELLERVDYTRVSLEGNTLTLPAGVELDLGAVAKGYAGDRVAALLREQGVENALLELGGNIHTVGSKPDGSLWRVAVTDPAGDGYAGVVEVADKAVVTSGGYERYFEQHGETYWHIIDPATGYPARTGLQSVTIVAEEGVKCDALSTALFVMGPEKAEKFWRETGGFDFILLTGGGEIVITEGIEDSFSPYGAWIDQSPTVLRR